MIRVRLREVMAARAKDEARITYRELSEQTGISKATLESIGSRGDYNPTLDTIDKICGALGCKLDELLERVEEDAS